eukprot:CAMPEP_0197007416 /NCGR_PEP_ID=MMETSP1380-20130617/40475_1 /TAXON_ID=5936 /ORGANISM="Euplotes crassus, Strain CT5" /LENGTH=71 /DNA_ID=CAMNT_0042427485 /DNA_START=223 /DNA_END=434 /DNA_ORIENTATION=-
MRNGSGERAIFKLMKMPILAYTPIYDELDKFKEHGIDLAFVYGDRDWMNTDMNEINISAQLQQKGEKVYIL